MAETAQSFNEELSVSNDKKLDVSKAELTDDGKNLKQIKCQRCPSTILVPGTATLVVHEFILPDPNLKGKENEAVDDYAKKYWCVDSMYAFENVGFSKTVDGVKYLICADCEVGPIGWHDLNTKLSYVSLSKISYC